MFLLPKRRDTLILWGIKNRDKILEVLRIIFMKVYLAFKEKLFQSKYLFSKTG